MGISFRQKGNFEKAIRFAKEMEHINEKERKVLEQYGQKGVSALAAATPVRSGLTASSWTYEISSRGNGIAIEYKNSNVNQGVNIAIILQMGHGTGTGGYVQGRDYINPAIRPVFDQMAEQAWEEVNRI